MQFAICTWHAMAAKVRADAAPLGTWWERGTFDPAPRLHPQLPALLGRSDR